MPVMIFSITWFLACIMTVSLAALLLLPIRTSLRDPASPLISITQHHQEPKSSPPNVLKSGIPRSLQSSKTFIVTYANTALRASLWLLYRSILPFQDAGHVSDVFVYTEEDLPRLMPQACWSYHPNLTQNPHNRHKYQRGNGYWLWKPFIVSDALQRIQPGDILLYMDAGCIMQSSITTFNQFQSDLQKVNQSPSGFLPVGFQSEFTNAQWTKPSVLAAFNINADSVLARRSQILGGMFWIRKNSPGQQIINEWRQVASNTPHFFLPPTANENSIYKTHRQYQDHRHDQSILSLLYYNFLSRQNYKANHPFLDVLKFDKSGPKESYVVFWRTFKDPTWKPIIRSLEAKHTEKEWQAMIHQMKKR